MDISKGASERRTHLLETMTTIFLTRLNGKDFEEFRKWASSPHAYQSVEVRPLPENVGHIAEEIVTKQNQDLPCDNITYNRVYLSQMQALQEFKKLSRRQWIDGVVQSAARGAAVGAALSLFRIGKEDFLKESGKSILSCAIIAGLVRLALEELRERTESQQHYPTVNLKDYHCPPFTIDELVQEACAQLKEIEQKLLKDMAFQCGK